MTTTAYLALIVWCVALSALDIRTGRLPDVLTLPGAAVMPMLAASTGRAAVAIAGALLLAVPYLLVHLIEPAACGAGDVKLALGTGAAAALGGPSCWVSAAIGAPLLTASAGVGALVAARAAAAGGSDRRRGVSGAPITLPHGPAMCLATVAALWPTV
ncbi:prepilin peptidase [Nocardia africana]|uniref:Type IV leader peptidase family n=1 Tax=Nocardia africana TaxID=134964 RepID=A0A378WZ33_9NOCA|nr:A24 family peptidase [Nocardia africana]MCC3312798.1 A24 family peptidase [Nocardia africana]SUA45865.1 Type IV leader peptidase family [Nocardia africana]